MNDPQDNLVRLSNDCLVILVGRTGLRLGTTFLHGIDAEYGRQTKDLWNEGPQHLGDNLHLRESTFYAPKHRDQTEDELPPFRAVALDLDSKSVEEAGIRHRLAAQLNYTGGGAEMLWPEGYTEAEKLKDQITSVLNKAGAGSVRNFILFHGTSHGTGSGLASWLVDYLRSEYGQRREQARNLLTFTVTPSGDAPKALPYKDTEAVTGPSYYNTLLTLNTLLGTRPGQPTIRPGAFRTLIVTMDNPATARAWREATGQYPSSSTYDEINHAMARAALAITSPLRFGPTDLGNVFVYFAQDHPATLTYPAISPLIPSQDDAPFQLAYDALYHGALAQAPPSLQQCYFLFRGNVDRSSIRHVQDLMEDRFNFTPGLYSCVPEPSPNVPVEFTALIRPQEPTNALIGTLEKASKLLEEEAYLHTYEGWGYGAKSLEQNIQRFTQRVLNDQPITPPNESPQASFETIQEAP